MKALFLVCALFLAPCFLSAQSFTVAVSPAVQSGAIGQTSTYSVSILPLNGFKATAFLSVSTSRTFSGTSVLSSRSPNAPYANITLKITPSIQDTGTFTFTVKAENSGAAATATCALSVAKNVQWTTLIPPKEIQWYGNTPIYLHTNRDGDVCFTSARSPFPNYDILYNRFTNQQWESKYLKSATNNFHSRSFYFSEDRKGALWLHKDEGIAVYDGQYETIYTTSNSSLPTNELYKLQFDMNDVPSSTARDRNYSYDIRLLRFNGNDWQSTLIPKPLVGNRSRYVSGLFCIDSLNRFWFTVDSGGIVRMQDTTFDTIHANGTTSLWSDIISQVFCDRTGKVWCLYGGFAAEKALSYFDGTIWHHIDSPVKNGYLGSYLLDFDNNIWLITANAWYVYNGTTWTTYQKGVVPMPDNIRSMTIDKHNNIWMVVGDVFYIFNPNGLVDIPLAPTAVEEEPISPHDGITISPNPTSTSFTISGIDNISSVKILNSLGMEVSRKSLVVSGKLEVDVSDLTTGVYFVQVQTAVGIMSKALIINR
jgi:hypothetical protein